jgi:dephospho-CoA kinase
MAGMDAEVRRSVHTKPVIGLAGGIGSGKSTVARMLGELGAGVIASDELNRRELESPEVIDRLRSWWGSRVVSSDGRVDRTALRQIVTGDADDRRRLEGLLHPRIARRRLELTAEYRNDPRVRAIVWDSPLLFEAGIDRQCDAVIFVETDEAIRSQRILSERGWPAGQLERLEKTQKSLDFKRGSADYRVVNNSDRDALRQEVEAVFSRILSGI